MKNVKDANNMLMTMGNLVSAPGSAEFNFVVAGLSKEGEMYSLRFMI